MTGRADSGRLHFNRCPTRSWAGWWRLDAASFVDAAGAEATSAPAAHARRSPAHYLVGQQHATHLRVLVLALVHDGLRRGGDKQRRGLRGARGFGAQAPGALRVWRAAGARRARGYVRAQAGHPPGRVTPERG